MKKPAQISEIRKAAERVIELEGNIAKVRYKDTLYLLDELDKIYAAFNTCGIDGIYDTFHSPVDAIEQMAECIKEIKPDGN